MRSCAPGGRQVSCETEDLARTVAIMQRFVDLAGQEVDAMWKRLSSLFRRSRLDRELSEEIETHLAMQEELFRRQGMTSEAARLAARREFGGVAQTMEVYRDRRGIRWIESVE